MRLTLLGVVTAWFLMQYEAACNLPSCAVLLSTCIHFVCVLEFDGVSYWCSIQYEAVSSRSCAILLFRIHHNNVNDGPALIFVGCMYETGVVLALDEQLVRLYCCV